MFGARPISGTKCSGGIVSASAIISFCPNAAVFFCTVNGTGLVIAGSPEPAPSCISAIIFLKVSVPFPVVIGMKRIEKSFCGAPEKPPGATPEKDSVAPSACGACIHILIGDPAEERDARESIFSGNVITPSTALMGVLDFAITSIIHSLPIDGYAVRGCNVNTAACAIQGIQISRNVENK